MKTLICIDPGKSGGIALRPAQTPSRVAAFPMPETGGDILGLLANVRKRDLIDGHETACVLEEVSGFAGTGQPGSAMFKFGRGVGFLEGVLQALGVRLLLVRPQKWQKAFSLGTASACATKTEWKNKLKAEAQRRFPELKVTLATADALLILEYSKTIPEL